MCKITKNAILALSELSPDVYKNLFQKACHFMQNLSAATALTFKNTNQNLNLLLSTKDISGNY